MIFRHYRELVRPADAKKWFAVTSASVEAAKVAREAGAESKIVRLPKTPAAVAALLAARNSTNRTRESHLCIGRLL